MEKINPENLDFNNINNLPLNRIGNLIKEARINRDQSVVELASDLKISAQQLKAIEDGREDLLPEKVFVKAMVKRISEKLKLDTNFIMGELNNKNEETNIENTVKEVSENKPKSSKSKPLGFFISILISGTIGFYTSSFMFNLFFDIQNETNSEEVIQKF